MKPKPIAREGVASPTLRHTLNPFQIRRSHRKQECALEIIPLIAWLGLPISDRHQHLVQIGETARNAAAAAISLDQYDKAIEWLEQGRSIVWTQILQLRTPVDRLREVNPELAERLLQVSQLIDHGDAGKKSQQQDRSNLEEEDRQHRALTTEWEGIVEKIRCIEGFEDFLKPPKLSRLLSAAVNGPLVVLNVAKQRCDALVLVAGFDEVIHIPLPNLTFETVTQLQQDLKDMLVSSGIRLRVERAAKQIESDDNDEDKCQQILAELWTNLVKPILDCLAFFVCCFRAISMYPADLVIPSPIRIHFPGSGGALQDLLRSSPYMQLEFTMWP
jgi:hypothetical protein